MARCDRRLAATGVVAAAAQPRRDPAPAQTGDDVPSSAGAAPPPARADPLVVFLGDSLTAGLGVNEDQAYPALVAQRLAAEGHPVRVLNAGVSGDTRPAVCAASNGCWRSIPTVVVVALGANDGLRGLPLERDREQPARIVTRGARGRLPRAAARHDGAAQLRTRLRAEVRGDVPAPRQGARRAAGAVPARRRGRTAGAQPGRRHPPDAPRGTASWRRPSIRGSPTIVLEARFSRRQTRGSRADADASTRRRRRRSRSPSLPPTARPSRRASPDRRAVPARAVDPRCAGTGGGT